MTDEETLLTQAIEAGERWLDELKKLRTKARRERLEAEWADAPMPADTFRRQLPLGYFERALCMGWPMEPRFIPMKKSKVCLPEEAETWAIGFWTPGHKNHDDPNLRRDPEFMGWGSAPGGHGKTAGEACATWRRETEEWLQRIRERVWWNQDERPIIERLCDDLRRKVMEMQIEDIKIKEPDP